MVAGLLVLLVCGSPPTANPQAEAHKDAVAQFGLAVWNLRHERLLTAVAQLEAAAKQDPDATAPLRELVRVYTVIGREPDAIRVARQVLSRDPADVDVAHALARLLFDAGELKEAAAAARLAANGPLPAGRADKAVAVYRDLATLCEKLDDHAEAEVALGKAVSLLTMKRADVIAGGAFSPRDADTAAAECLERLGRVQTRLRKYDAAAGAFASAARLYSDPLKANDTPSAARLSWNLSGVLQAKGEPAAALRELEAFLKLRPVSPEPYARLAQLLREAGRGGEVETRLDALAKADPENHPLAAVCAAELARDPGSRAEGDRRFARLMASTNDPKVVEVVVRSHLETRRPREVVAVLDRAYLVLKDKDDKTGEKPLDTPETAAARAFAADKARAIAGVLKDNKDAVVAMLGAAAEDARTGTKRTYHVHYFLGQLAARHQNLPIAAHHFQEALGTAHRDTIGDAYAGLIAVLVTARKPAELKRVCQDALGRIDTLPLAAHYFNYYLAGALADLGEEKAAVAAADAAILTTAAGDYLLVRLLKLRVLNALGKWDEAVAFGKALLDEVESRADRNRVRYTLAGAYWGAKKLPEAEAELRAVLDADPDNDEAANDLGFHLAEQGRDLPEAERLVRHAIAVDRADRRRGGDPVTENAAYLDSLGWVLFRKGDYAAARAELERAVALHAGASEPGVWDHLGDVLFRSGEKAKARAAWGKAVELYELHDHPGSRGRRDGRLDEARRKLKRVE